MTNAEKSHLAAIASLPCAICGARPVSVHHIRRFGEKRDNWKTSPLCYLHHQGTEGIHHLGKKEWERRFITQEELINRTNEMMEGK
jgi:hypothetical protein